MMRTLLCLLLALITLFATACASRVQPATTTAAAPTPTPTPTPTPAPTETPTPTPTLTPTPTPTPTPTETPTPSPLTPEKLLELEDQAYLDTVSYPKYQTGEAGEAYYFGRWFEKEIEGETHEVTTTDGSQIFFLTEGCTSVTFDFTIISKLETPYFAVSIDGGEAKRQPIDKNVVTLPDEGRHVLRVVVDSMNQNEDKWRNEIGVALKGIVLGEGGRMRAIIPRNKVVFFFGDSITEGIAAFGANAPRSNSSTNAYPWFAAKKLGAIPYYVGYSGSGVTVEGSFTTFARAVDKLSMSRSIDKTVIPDLIVINHGTNDGSGSSANFRDSLSAALDKLVKLYPGVPIIYMIPFCQNRVEDIGTVCANYENITVVPTDGWRVSYSDGIHPSSDGAKRAGETLAGKINEILGKKFFSV